VGGDVMTPRDWEALAQESLDPSDVAILGRMRAGLDDIDPPPVGLTDRIQFALTVAALEAEVADIVAAESLAAVRSDDYDRATTITFASDGFSATVSLEPRRAGALGLRGWVSDPGTEVEVRERSRSQFTTSDEHGRFGFASLQPGLIHLVFRRPSGPPPVITPALEI